MRTTSLSQQDGNRHDARNLNRSIDCQSFLSKYIYRSELIWYDFGILIRISWTLIYSQRGYIHPVKEKYIEIKYS